MGASLVATTPGLNYDPRQQTTRKFFEALEQELKTRSPKPRKIITVGNPKPLPDPGVPVFKSFAKPGVPPLVGGL